MKITVATLHDEIFVLDISDELELENFKAFCEVESGIALSEMILLHQGRPLLDDKMSLKKLGILDGDVIVLQEFGRNQNVPRAGAIPQIDFSEIKLPGNNNSQGFIDLERSQTKEDMEAIRNILLQNPDQLSTIMHTNPELGDALLSDNFVHFNEILQAQQKQQYERDQQKLRLLSASPLDVESQRLIAEEIRQKNIDANMEAAIEYSPESFATVTMLYINCRVNGHHVKAFIDSGAQTTIMSSACAERCNIMRLVDTRWSAVAKGVGMQKIIGRVHVGQIQIESDFLFSSFSILEDQPMDMMLGLDMLKRHQCCIDLKNNILVIGTTGTVTRFLSENELPECAKFCFEEPKSTIKYMDPKPSRSN